MFIWMTLLTALAHEMPSNLSTDLVFAKNDVAILPLAAPKLEELATLLAESPKLIVEIRVHSDQEGDDAANLALTQRRADALRDWLVKRGVSEGQLTSTGVGEAEPMVDATTAGARARNRRVEFKMLQDADHD